VCDELRSHLSGLTLAQHAHIPVRASSNEPIQHTTIQTFNHSTNQLQQAELVQLTLTQAAMRPDQRNIGVLRHKSSSQIIENGHKILEPLSPQSSDDGFDDEPHTAGFICMQIASQKGLRAC
jgi:hypothetical protein